jgi:hypothetical protein
MASEEIPSNRPARKRVALGPRGRRLSFERRLRHKLWAMGLPAAVLAAMLLWDQGWVAAVIGLLCVAATWRASCVRCRRWPT